MRSGCTVDDFLCDSVTTLKIWRRMMSCAIDGQ